MEIGGRGRGACARGPRATRVERVMESGGDGRAAWEGGTSALAAAAVEE